MRCLLSVLLLASVAFPAVAQSAPARKAASPKGQPAKTASVKPNRPKPAAQLYDSTRVSFAKTLPQGVTHKAAQQAVITYGKIGARQPLDRTDSLFLQQTNPAYLEAIAEQPELQVPVKQAKRVKGPRAASRPR